MKMRVAAYCRVSTDNRDQENSFESQKRYFDDYIKMNQDWELVEIYADKGFSGTSTSKRIAFQKMILDAKDKKMDLILTKEISRFARNTMDSIEYTRMLKKLGVGVKFINDGINTIDNDGELRLTIMAGIAQDESRRTSERVKWGQKRRMEQGVVFGRELYGYNLEKGVLSINEEEAETVKLIFHKYLNEGKGTHVIARELYESNIMPKRTKRWSNSMILKMLRNEKYVGDLEQKKTITLDYLDHKKIYNKGQEEKVYLKDHHEAIIDRDMWNAVQVELDKRTLTKEQKSKHSNRYWCSGKLTCGECGSKFVSRTKNLKNGNLYKTWRCHNNAQFGSKKLDTHGNEVGCNIRSVNYIALNNVVNFILEYIKDYKDKAVSSFTSEIKNLRKKQKIQNTDSLLKKIEGINIKKQKLIDSMLDGIISQDDMSLMNEKYDSEIRELKEDIKAIEEINLINKNQADNLQVYIDRINSIIREMTHSNMDDIYKKTVDKIIVYENNILLLYLTCSPYPYKIQYHCTGKNENYKTECELLSE